MLILDKSGVLRAMKYLVFPDAADIPPAGDFTLEFFDVNFTSTASQATLWSHYNATGSQRSMLLQYVPGTGLQFVGSTNGSATTAINYAWTPTVGTPYQIAAERSGTTVRLYVDGAVGNSGTISGAFFNSSSDLIIGAGISGSAVQFPFTGSAKAVRFTQGTARYAGAYTPPTLPLPTS